MRSAAFAFLIATSLIPLAGEAHPVSFQGAVGVMTWNQTVMADDWLTYSVRSDVAVAARHMRFEMPNGRMQFYAPQLDLLLKRFNEMDYQANLYAYGAFGSLQMNGQNQNSWLAGAEADAESRKYFVSAKYEKMWMRDESDFYHVEARLGIAPYEAEFNEIASWLMIQYQYHPTLVKKAVLTPLVRLFYKSVLVEMGAGTEGDWMLNFMFHF